MRLAQRAQLLAQPLRLAVALLLRRARRYRSPSRSSAAARRRLEAARVARRAQQPGELERPGLERLHLRQRRRRVHAPRLPLTVGARRLGAPPAARLRQLRFTSAS